jgi:hypothetical protein
LAVSLAIAFEIGAAASLAALIALDRMSKWMVWGVFIILTAMQMMGNTYYTYVHLQNYQGWVELFGLAEEDPIFQKRVLSIISGAILPIIALGFIKSLVDYIRPTAETDAAPPAITQESAESPLSSISQGLLADDDITVWDSTLQDGLEEEAHAFNISTEENAPTQEVITPELTEFLEQTGELTPEDINFYKEKTKEESKNSRRGANPQVIPGVN